MNDPEAIRRFLVERGCPDEVVAGGLPGLVSDWERVVDQVATGYTLGLDDYLNDLDGRQLLEETLAIAPASEAAAVRERVRAADARMRALVKPTPSCLWGDRVAESEEWTPERNWWYFNLPRELGPLLREDLEDW